MKGKAHVAVVEGNSENVKVSIRACKCVAESFPAGKVISIDAARRFSSWYGKLGHLRIEACGIVAGVIESGNIEEADRRDFR